MYTSTVSRHSLLAVFSIFAHEKLRLGHAKEILVHHQHPFLAVFHHKTRPFFDTRTVQLNPTSNFIFSKTFAIDCYFILFWFSTSTFVIKYSIRLRHVIWTYSSAVHLLHVIRDPPAHKRARILLHCTLLACEQALLVAPRTDGKPGIFFPWP
jgi:hypothetical protein